MGRVVLDVEVLQKRVVGNLDLCELSWSGGFGLVIGLLLD